MSLTKKLSGKELVQVFFLQETTGGTIWACRCGKKCQQKGSGYTNLVSHIMRIHHDQYLKLRGKKKTFTSVMDTFWPKKAQTLSAWLLLIVNGLLPFSFCENECAHQCMKQGPISCTTLIKYLNKLTVIVKKKIADVLPEKFAKVL